MKTKIQKKKATKKTQKKTTSTRFRLSPETLRRIKPLTVTEPYHVNIILVAAQIQNLTNAWLDFESVSMAKKYRARLSKLGYRVHYYSPSNKHDGKAPTSVLGVEW